VREGVLMNMRMVLYQCIDHNERRTRRHHDQHRKRDGHKLSLLCRAARQSSA
jgi:hypothetical protein